jgi:hypothetical protein
MNDILASWMLVGLLSEAGCLAYAAIVIKEKITKREMFELTVLSLIGGPIAIISILMYIMDKKSD